MSVISFRSHPWLIAPAVLALIAIPAGTALANSGASKGNSSGKQTICHATNSNTNPYVVNTPNKNGDVSGHAKHTGPLWTPTLKSHHISWGDIIPPFTYTSHGATAHYAGMNWTANGMAWFNNGCRVPITASLVKTNDASGDSTFTHDETVTSEGASVPFSVVITNTSVVPAVLSSLVDTVGGNPVAFTCATPVVGTTLAAGASITCLFTENGYSPPDGQSKVNTATVTLHQVGNTSNSGSANDSSTVRTSLPDVAIVKTGPASAAPGDTLTWTLTAQNTGTVPASTVAVSDTLPDGTTLVSATGTGWTCSGTTAVSCALAGSLGVGASAVVTITATLSSTFTGTSVSNTAVVTPTDNTPGDNTSTVVTTVTAGGGNPTPSPSASPFTGGGGGATTTTPKTAGGGKTLPFTGFPTGLYAGLAVAALFAGLGLTLLAPRRRSFED